MKVSFEETEAGCAARPAFIKVWDPFVRLFHWLLVTFFAVAWISAEGSDLIHEYAGYIVAGLIGARIIWGLIGTRHARFTDFIYRPSTVIAYLKDAVYMRARRYIGHNPAGGAMILALILSLIAVSATGIMTTTDAYHSVKWVKELHELTANLTLVLVIGHLAGVALASFQHRENLVKSMLTGLKRAQE